MSASFPPSYARDPQSWWAAWYEWAGGRLYSLLKYIYHLVTGTSEIQRLLVSNQPATSIVMAIKHSKQLLEVNQAMKSQSPQFTEISAMIAKIKLGGSDASMDGPESSLVAAHRLDEVVGYLENLHVLKAKVFSVGNIKYDSNNVEHEQKLERLWEVLKPGVRRNGDRITKEWEEIGFQGKDPATDFRGMGLLGLNSLVEFGTTYPASAQKVLLQAQFPFAITGIKIAGLICEWLRDGSLDIHFVGNGSSLEQYYKLFAALFFAFVPFYDSRKPKNLMSFPPIWNEYCNQVYDLLSQGQPLFDSKGIWLLQPALAEASQR